MMAHNPHQSEYPIGAILTLTLKSGTPARAILHRRIPNGEEWRIEIQRQWADTWSYLYSEGYRFVTEHATR